MRNGFIFILIFIVSITSSFSSVLSESDSDPGDTPTQALVSLSGLVEDKRTHEKLVCVKIEIIELGKTIFTDISGSYTIDGLNPGNYTLKISYIAYENLLLKQIPVGQQKNELNIQLKPL